MGAGLLSAKRAALTVTAVAVMLAVMTAGAAQDSDVRDEALALSLGAVDAYESGDMEEAERLYRESLPLYEELGDDNGLAMTYHGLGLSYELRGEIGEARLWFLRSLELNELRGFVQNSVRNHISLGGLWVKEGAAVRACEHYAVARVRLEELGISGGVERVSGWMRDLGCPIN